jgi:phosphoglucosamine mutase
VVLEAADLGIALDGDGDRLVMVDDAGNIVDGDELLLVIALYRQAKGDLRGGVVGTLMSNLGLEVALKHHNIDFVRSAVGDRHVLADLVQRDWALGGEGSGHILCLDQTTTGDGVVSALQVLVAIVGSGKTLRHLVSVMDKYPQTMINVKDVSPGAMQAEPVLEAVAEVEQALGAEGRVLLRPSGTEPVLRVMVEGRHSEQVKRFAEELAQVVGSVPH